MKDTAQTYYSTARAVLWLDEQEYFSERWRVIHPRDNAFEGGPGTLLSVFPVLSINDRIDMSSFSQTFWTPYASTDLTDNSRMACSRYAKVVTGNTYIYSMAFFWACTDRTWRWRPYPAINQNGVTGETIDTASIQIRDDQTICLKGRKYCRDSNGVGSFVDGYWYQRYLGPDNTQVGTPAKNSANQPIPPQYGYNHPWNFMSIAAFGVADTGYYKLGMYEQSSGSSSVFYAGKPNTNYAYKGYTPRTHVLRFTGGVSSPSTYIGKVFNVYSNASYTSPLYHPMYKELPVDMKPIVRLTVVDSIGNQLRAVFTSPKDDDLMLKDVIGTGTYYFRQASGGSAMFSSDTAHMIDFNTWEDCPVGTVSVNYGTFAIQTDPFGGTTNKTGLRFSFSLPPNYTNYCMKYLKVGVVDGGAVKVWTMDMSATRVISNSATDVVTTITQADWNKYFSEAGRATYGTTLWVESSFGNSNTFAAVQ
jgi:hypothetical protein